MPGHTLAQSSCRLSRVFKAQSSYRTSICRKLQASYSQVAASKPALQLNMTNSKVAVVTGATGFVAAELVKQLLAQGWTVKGTVRGSEDSDRSKALQAWLPSADATRLSLHSADLLQPGAFDEIVSGAQYVFHVASPFQVEVADPDAQLLQPALEGTRNVMAAVAKHKDSIKRVVLTSSVAAVHDMLCKQPPSQGDLYTEADFNTTSTMEKEGYWVSKVRAEQEAWSIAESEGVDLITIVPEFIMGPVSTLSAASTSLSAGFMKAFLEAPGGKVPSGSWIFSDVREVAAAHILAATNPAAKGRYIVACSDALNAQQVSSILKERFPQLDLVPGDAAETKYNLDNSKAPRELGLQLRPTAQTLADMAQSLIDVGFAHPKAK